MTRRPGGAVPTVEEIYALIIMVGGQYVLLDTDVANLLRLSVDTLYDRVWRRLATSCDVIPEQWYFFRLRRDDDDAPLAYSLFGIVEALKASGKRSTARVLAQRIGEAFDIKEAECRALGLQCPRRGMH